MSLLTDHVSTDKIAFSATLCVLSLPVLPSSSLIRPASLLSHVDYIAYSRLSTTIIDLNSAIRALICYSIRDYYAFRALYTLLSAPPLTDRASPYALPRRTLPPEDRRLFSARLLFLISTKV